MAEPSSPSLKLHDPEAGYMLVAVIVMVALVLIALSVAAPVVAKDLRRQKEIESRHRAEQYVRAIRLYYRKTKAYPPSIDALKNTNNIRFLRQEYVDPLTGKNDWRLIHLGEQKTTVKGFFGQELGGLATGGLGSAAGLASGTGTPIGSGGLGGPLGSAGTSASTTIGASSPLNAGFPGASTTGTPTSGAFGSTGSTGSTGSSGLGGGLGGGGAIIGVSTAHTGDSISTPNKQTSYESWEFWYDPRIEQLYQKGKTNAGIGTGGLGSQPAAGFGSGLGSQPAAGFGSGANGHGTPGAAQPFGSPLGSSGSSAAPSGTTPNP